MSENPRTKSYWKIVKRIAKDLALYSRPRIRSYGRRDPRLALLVSVPPSMAMAAIDQAIEDARRDIAFFERSKDDLEKAIAELECLKFERAIPPFRLIKGGRCGAA